MSRERINAPQTSSDARARHTRAEHPDVTRIRARAAEATAEIELSDEDLRALADEGIDPEEVQALARTPHDEAEVSDFDRQTARDDIEGLRPDEGY